MLRRTLPLALLSFAIASCGIEIPDATYTCTSTAGCPSGFVCSVGLCRRHEIDGNVCSAETCNGVDDDCDGFVDDGVLSLSAPAPVTGSDGSDWSDDVPDGAGGRIIVFTVYDNPNGVTRIYATHEDSTGSVVAGPTELAQTARGHIEASALGSNFHVLYEEYGTQKLLIDQFSIATLARVGTPFEVAAGCDDDMLDVVDVDTTNGPRAYVVYQENDLVKMRAITVPALTDNGFPTDVFTPTANDPRFDFGLELVPAPCGRMFFVVMHRSTPGSSIVRILPVTPFGNVLTTGYDIVPDGTDILFTRSNAVPIGGSCTADPTGLAIAWVQGDTLAGTPTRTDLRLDTYDIAYAAADPKVAFTRTSRIEMPSPGGFLFAPQAIFAGEFPMTLSRVTDGRYYVAASVLTSTLTAGRIDVYEFLPDGTHNLLPLTAGPTFAIVFDAPANAASPSDLVFTAAEWSDASPTRQYALSCTPP